MKICVLGNNFIARQFRNLNFDVINVDYTDFKIEYVLPYNVIINTYDYTPKNVDKIDMLSLKLCNIDIPLLLSEYCNNKYKTYVQISSIDTSNFTFDVDENTEFDNKGPIKASKYMTLSGLNDRDLIIRTKNVFSGDIVDDNPLFKTITTKTPSDNLDTYTYYMDLVRGIASLLRNNKSGVYNIASNECMSQTEILDVLGIKYENSFHDEREEMYYNLRLEKIKEVYTPQDTRTTIKKAFEEIKKKLEA